MQTTILNSKTATAESRANVDKWLESAGFIPTMTKIVIYYIYNDLNRYNTLTQFARTEATRTAYSYYMLHLYGDDIRAELFKGYGVAATLLTDQILVHIIGDAASYIFEMIATSNK